MADEIVQLGGVPARKDVFTPLLPSFVHYISSRNYKRNQRGAETEEAYSERMALELEMKILELGPGNVMAWIAEPVAGGASMGIMPPPKGYFTAMEKVCKRYGVLMIFDEVMCGELYAYTAVAEGMSLVVSGHSPHWCRVRQKLK